MSKFIEIENHLLQHFPGTAEQLRMMSVSLVTHTHVFLYGPGGTAKTSLFRQYAKALPWNTWFRQFNRETTLRDVFGSRDIPALMQGREAYLREGTLYHADLGIFDEVFNAPADCLTSLNLALNERELEEPGNRAPTKLPLKVVWAAANKFPPISRPEVAAMYDRFLMRANVVPVKDHTHRAQILVTSRALRQDAVSVPALDAHTLAATHTAADGMAIRDSIRDALLAATDALEKAGVSISPRREAAMAHAMTGHAVVRGRATPGLPDLVFAVRAAGWHELEHLPAVRKVVDGLGNDADRLATKCVTEAETALQLLSRETAQMQSASLVDAGRLRPIVERLNDAYKTLQGVTQRPVDEDEFAAALQRILHSKQKAIEIIQSAVT